jgi:hypothetical protein
MQVHLRFFPVIFFFLSLNFFRFVVVLTSFLVKIKEKNEFDVIVGDQLKFQVSCKLQYKVLMFQFFTDFAI